MSNEDYLDSLLKQMSVENTDPESAINRVRRAQSNNEEQADDVSVETAKTVEKTEAEAMPDLSAPVFLDSEETPVEEVEVLIDEEPSQKEKKSTGKKTSAKTKKEDKTDKKAKKETKVKETKTKETKTKETKTKESKVKEVKAKKEEAKRLFEEDKLNSLLEAVVRKKEVPVQPVKVEKTPVVEEVLAVEEAPAIEELPVEEVFVEEAPGEDTLIEEVALEVSEEPVSTEDLDAILKAAEETTETIEEEIPAEEVSMEETNTEEILPTEDLDELLKAVDGAEEALPEEAPAEEAPAEDATDDDSPVEDAGDLDIGALLEAADGETESNEETLDGSDISEVNIEDLLNAADNGETVDKDADTSDIDALLADLAEPTETEKMADGEKDEALNLSEEEVEKMLESASSETKSEPEGELEIDLADLDSLESLGIYDKNDIDKAGDGSASGEGELGEISDLLKSLDSNEVSELSDDTDMLKLLNDAVSEQEAEEAKLAEDEAYRENAARDRENAKSSKEEGKKGKKKKKKEAAEGEEQTPGLWKKILDFLTAAEEEEEDELLKPSDAPSEGAEGQEAGKAADFEDVNGENKEILDEMDKEEEDGKKKKKKKKKKGKKGEEASESEGGEGEEGSEAAPKKEKKEKKPRKPLILDIDTGKPLSKKNVRLIGVMAASLLIAIIIFATSIPGLIVNGQARKAYYKGDYETVYRVFYGEKLKESDQLMFDRAELILKVEHKFDAFAAYNKMNMKVEALDQLLQAVATFDEWLITSEINDNEEEFRKSYNKILSALQINYDLTEEQARAINALETDLEYSLMVEAVVNNTEYIDPNEPLPEPFVPPASDSYKDVLPEEE